VGKPAYLYYYLNPELYGYTSWRRPFTKLTLILLR
jgi:hypothetical protein